LANGYISIPNRKEQPSAKRHEDFILIASANTWGAGSYEYHGRNHLDAAFLDRFSMSRVFVDYDKDVEKEYTQECPDFAKILWAIRKNCVDKKVRKIVSTRAFKEGAIQIKAGRTINQVLDRFTTGWTKEEIEKTVEPAKALKNEKQAAGN
jgi:MoxR-like ATPase